MKRKYYLALDTAEWRLIIDSLNNLRRKPRKDAGKTVTILRKDGLYTG